MKVVSVLSGDAPVILAFPHASTWLPSMMTSRLNDQGLALADTDWHVDRLYCDLLPGATWVRAEFSRYLIDANRDPAGLSLYPGQNTTDLCPVTDFEGEPIYVPGQEPDKDEITERVEQFHKPYHAALAAEIERLQDQFRCIVIYDCHSIRSVLPFLFEGQLPDLNIGTHDGASCRPVLPERVTRSARPGKPYSVVVNGRFKGGWTTRHYGRPLHGVEAIQMEIAQSTYLQTESPPFAYDAEKASALRGVLRRVLAEIRAYADECNKTGETG